MLHVRWLVVAWFLSLILAGTVVHCAEQYPVTLVSETTPSGPGNGGGGVGGGTLPSA